MNMDIYIYITVSHILLDDLSFGEELFHSFECCLKCVSDKFLLFMANFYENPEKATAVGTEAEDAGIKVLRDELLDGVVSLTSHSALRSSAWLDATVCSDNDELIKYKGDILTTLPRLHKIDSESAGDDTKISDAESAKVLRAITHQDFNFCLATFDQTVMDQLQKLHTTLATPARIAKITNSICKDTTTRLSGMRSLLEAVSFQPEAKTIGIFYDRSDNTVDVDTLDLKLSNLAPAADETGKLVNLAMKLNDTQSQAQFRVVDLLAKCLPACSKAAVKFKNVFSKGPKPEYDVD